MSLRRTPVYSPYEYTLSNPANPRRHSAHRPFSSSGELVRKGVRHSEQKNSAINGVGPFRHSEQTGIRERFRSGMPQTRQSSGKTRLNIAAGIDRSSEVSDNGLSRASHLLWKTHLQQPATFYHEYGSAQQLVHGPVPAPHIQGSGCSSAMWTGCSIKC